MKAKSSHRNINRISPALMATIAALGASAQAASFFDLSTTTYIQDFDSMGNVSGVNALPVGWGFNVATTFADSLTDTTRGAGTTGTGVLSGTSGGGAYLFVNGVLATDTDKAIGFLTSGSYADNRNILFGFTNNTGLAITSLSLSFDFEKYRSGTASRDWTFFASDSDTAWGTAIFDGGQSYGSDAANTVISNPPLSQSKTVTINGLSLAVGANYYFRWNYDGSGTGSSGQGLGIDNLSIIASGGAAGRNLLWSPITGAWDLTAQNWSEVGTPGTPVLFQAGDRVTFDDSGLTNSTVTINVAGVTSGPVKVANTTGAYTFVGGAISGSGSITKTGAGKLILASANTFTGGTGVSDGTLAISDDTQLGAATGPLTLGSAGTLETTGSLTLNSTRPISGTGTISIAPSTTLDIAGPANTGALTLSNTGSLRFSGAASAQVGGFNILRETGVTTIQPLLLNGPFTTTNPDGTVTITGPLGLGASTRIFTIADGTAAVDASIGGAISSGSTNGRLHKLGDGSLALVGDNSGMTGGVQLGTAGSTPLNGGTLIINSSTSLGPGGAGTAGQFRLNAGILVASVPIQFPVALSVSLGNSAPLVSTFAGSDIEFLGVVSFFYTGTTPRPPHIIVANSNVRFSKLFNPTSPASSLTSGLTIQGTGSLTLVDGGEFTGDVSVDGGKLYITGNLAGALPVDNRPAITVANGGVLGGSLSGSSSLGVVNAIGSPGTLSFISPGTPLDVTGILAVTSVALLADSVLAIDIAGTLSEDFDQIFANGSVQLTGGLNLSITNGFIPVGGDSFTLISNDDVDPVDGFFLGKPENSTFMASGYEFRINYGAGDGNDVIVTAVPEPGSIALILGGIGFLGIGRRRRS